MTAHFTVAEVLDATGGRLVGKAPETPFTGVSTDSRSLTSGQLFVALVGERFDAHAFLDGVEAKGAGLAIVQAGRPTPPTPSLPRVEVEDTLVALGALARFHRRRFHVRLGAITGSNGKTSTKEMVAAILEQQGPALKTHGNLNNEIGLPLTLFRLEPEHRTGVVELGMNHLGEIDRLTRIAEPTAGLITVVQAVHTEGVGGGIEGVARAKGELFRALPEGATAVVNLDDPHIVSQAAGLSGPTITFGTAPAADVRLVEKAAIEGEGQRLTIEVKGARHTFVLHFLGEHNALNAAGAFALGLALGVPAEVCRGGLEAARPHAQRLRLVDGRGGIRVLDDCYNANPGSMSAGLRTLSSLAAAEARVAVLGDMLELGEEEAEAHARLGREAAATAGRLAFFGPRSEAAAQAASAAGATVAHFMEIDGLLNWLQPQLAAGDTVLVKGSRGMRLERVVSALTDAPTADGSH
ncbi:MAG TPA: UDP-N-acetylmuramoyl-tripeptide--D-alanyl-D-alanine ligase [Myxococcaceae bacterium]|nr:UDP-N-acetylmuramoyl-tripeptide--D-alanyl-D-alanine ligase [Myxococcaceae bacterium]